MWACSGVRGAQVVLSRHLPTTAVLLGVIVVFLASLATPTPVRAASFTPTTPAELIAAITTANTNGQDDVINLGGQTFTLTAVNNTTSGPNGLPELVADGGHTLTIRNGTIERQGAAPAFRLILIGSGAHVIFDQVTLRSGLASTAGLGTLGGAIFTNYATVSITRSRLTSNTATTGSGLGGAVFNNTSTLTISDTIFSGNVGEGGGGAVYAYAQAPGSATHILNSVLENNTSNVFGGAVAIELAPVTITNSTISNNVATNAGGGVYALGGSLTLAHATLSGNSAMTGGGLYNESFFSGVVTLRATILDTGTTGANCSGTITSIGSNLSNDNSCAFAQTGDVNNATLNLGALQDNGGPTLTHALLAGSAAIDAVPGFCTVDGTSIGAAIATDQRGALRPRGSACDAGAFETGTLSPGSLQFSAPTFTVGEAGPTASVTVTRTGGSDLAVGATVSLANGTATAPADYDNTAQTVSFASGDSTAKIVSIPIVNDVLDEADETILLTLASPTGGATLGAQTSATLTITDDDPAPTLSINDVTLVEGNAGGTAFAFTVALSAASGQQVTVQAQTADGGATSASTDYAATGPTTLTFGPGDTSETFTVQVNGDTTNEPDETFFVNLTSATNATILDNQGIGTITNDDGLPSFSIAGATVAEGDSGSSLAQFVVTRAGATALTSSVQYATADGTATAGTDYAAASGTLTFLSNETSKTVSVSILGDTVVEADETFTVTLSNPTNATVGTAQATGTISNDDGQAVISIASVTVGEGNGGISTAQFTVSRTGPLSASASVQFATADGSAAAGSDYVATSGTLSFAPGDATKIIMVQILGDTIVEADETFTVTLSNPTNVTVGTAQATGTIANDDIGACTPRPRVTQTLTADGSRLIVHIEATPLNTQANNPLLSIRFGTFQNAMVFMSGKTLTGGEDFPIPVNTFATSFVVRRVTPGQVAMVPFTVVDGCGEWKTFVGGGTGAGF